MRIFIDCKEFISEISREVLEMGIIKKPKSMQNLNVEGDDNYITKEILGYSYCLTSLTASDYLFVNQSVKEWADAELSERLENTWGDIPINPGAAYIKRLDVWEKFLVNGKFDYSYNERIHNHNALSKIISLLYKDPDTRQAVLSIWSPSDINHVGGKRRVPCTVYYQFIREGSSGALSIIYNQRSADVYTHFGNDVYLAYKLMEFVANSTGMKPGVLYHQIGSLHSYKKDWVDLASRIDMINNRNNSDEKTN